MEWVRVGKFPDRSAEVRLGHAGNARSSVGHVRSNLVTCRRLGAKAILPLLEHHSRPRFRVSY